MVEHPLPGRLEESDGFRVVEVEAHDPDLISRVIEIDLTTFSEPTWSRYTAGLMLRHGRTFLLFERTLTIGTCQVIRSWERPNEAALFSMAIRPGYRNRGLGSRFLRGVLDCLKADGFRSVVLEVDPSNASAMKVYIEKFGFRKVSDLKAEYGHGHDRVQMRLMLQDVDLHEVREFPLPS